MAPPDRRSRRAELQGQLALLDRMIEAERHGSWHSHRYESLLRERRITSMLLNLETAGVAPDAAEAGRR